MRLTGSRILALVLLLADQPVYAFTGEELFNECSDAAKEKQCEAYVRGVADGVTTLTVTAGILHPDSQLYPRLFCVEDVTSDELVRAVRRYLTDNPSTRHFNAASQVILALQGSFPCSRLGRSGL